MFACERFVASACKSPQTSNTCHMRWEKVSSNSTNEVYQLREKDKNLMTFTFHPFSNTGRIECEIEKRVFLIRKEGLLRNRTVMRNEYGIKLGELGVENKETFIDVNDERYFYTITGGDTPQLVLYKESVDEPFLVCGLNLNNGKGSVKLEKSQSASYPSLLMALAWYMFLPMAQQQREKVSA